MEYFSSRQSSVIRQDANPNQWMHSTGHTDQGIYSTGLQLQISFKFLFLKEKISSFKVSDVDTKRAKQTLSGYETL